MKPEKVVNLSSGGYSRWVKPACRTEPQANHRPTFHYEGYKTMASNSSAKRFKRSALTVALGLCFIGGVQAQSTVGAVTGRAASGDTITVENPATGFSRSITVDANGIYRFPALPIG